MEINEKRIIISFTNSGSDLIIRNGQKLNQFAIAGSDGKFVWSASKIEGNKVIVWINKVAIPVSVRYAWAYHPLAANLNNKEGLPASPFTTEKRKY